MSRERDELLLLRRLAREDHGLTVSDADTQETSYGCLIIDSTPLIFDTYRKESWFVSTAEALTEIGAPARATPEEVERFAKVAEHAGVQAIPYSACFFKGNLHVYAYYGPVRGLDLSVVADSVGDAERKLERQVRSLWNEIPPGIHDAHRDLLSGKRKAPYPEDIEVPMRRMSSGPR
jgi:hypothetical protein